MDPVNLMSIIGLVVQWSGILLITILSFFMTRSIRRTFLDYWTQAWVCLSFSLSCLLVAFTFPAVYEFFYPLYFLGEYAFGYMFVAGCRNYAGGARLSLRDLRMLVPGLMFAVGISRLSADFSSLFMIHAAIIAALFAAALHAIHSARRLGNISLGLRVMSVALLLLALDFLHYVPLLAYVRLWRVSDQFAYLKYTSIYDLILEIMLGFGTVMVVMDDVRYKVEEANRELIAARDKLEILARMDPLTEALNRHAFYSLLEKQQEDGLSSVSGCGVVIDIDNLKPINDSLGHAAGDTAIREVARSVRSLIRADDLLFRWGGDEFLVLLFGISESEARSRIYSLDESLSKIRLPGSPNPVRLIVSYGVASFATIGQIEQAVVQADAVMYSRKQARKAHDKLENAGGDLR